MFALKQFPPLDSSDSPFVLYVYCMHAQLPSCVRLCNPVDCSLQVSSVHGILQARVLEWVAIAFSDGCESWTIKKAESQRTDAFELWCWRRLLRVPWTARRSNQYIPKEISPGCSLEGLMLKLKFQYLGHLM